MPRGDKSKYTGKQERQAEHIEAGYKERGVPEDEAEKRAWATVNKIHGGGNQGGSGEGRAENKSVYLAAGHKGGKAKSHKKR